MIEFTGKTDGYDDNHASLISCTTKQLVGKQDEVEIARILSDFISDYMYFMLKKSGVTRSLPPPCMNAGASVA
jgi:hypothetical protein